MDRFAHIIWDWNGTLLDDVGLCLDVMNGMLRRRAMAPMHVDRYREIFDFPIVHYYRALGFDFDAEPFEDLAHEYCGEYDKRVRECRLHTDAEHVLGNLSRGGRTHTVLSSTEQQALSSAIEGFGLLCSPILTSAGRWPDARRAVDSCRRARRVQQAHHWHNQD